MFSQQQLVPKRFGIHQTKAPAEIVYKNLTRLGRDDDIDKLRKILKELWTKLHRGCVDITSCEKVLFGGDHKLANNLLKLQAQDDFFSKFLPLPPILHLRKSHINTLFSAYEKAGIIQILQVMKNDVRQDREVLAGKDHI